QVAQELGGWTSAWVGRDSAAYLGYYAPEFTPADGTSREAWEAARKRALARAARIRIERVDERIAVTGADEVTTTFRQQYSAAGYRDEVEKTLVWKNIGGRWLIVRETANTVPAAAGAAPR
ncbi:MAG: nuclear transport factor 2 family protein, partial [Candidatus Parcubacteria bacterium]|nr:nuclear transport factor 2 family protein [Burkholderiales bacterium]